MKVNQKILSAEDCVRVEENLYFVARDFNVVLKLEIKSGKVSIVGSIPEEETMSVRLGSKIIAIDNNLYFAPMSAKKIWKYNLENGEWSGYVREKIEEWAGTEEMFQAVWYKNKIYFIGSCYPAIIVFDVINENIDYLKEPFEKDKALAYKKHDCFFRTDVVHIDNYIFMASCLSNKVLKLNLDSYEYEYIEVGPINCSYSGIDYDGEYFYLSPRNGKMAVMWDGRKEWTSFELPIRDDCLSSFTIGNVLCREEKVYYISTFIDDSFWQKKRNTKEIFSYEERCWFCKKIDENTYVSLTYKGIITIDYLGKVYRYDFQIAPELLIKYLVRRMKENGEDYKKMHLLNTIVKEEDVLDLGLFLNML